MGAERRNIQGLKHLAAIYAEDMAWQQQALCFSYSEADKDRLWRSDSPLGNKHVEEAKAICDQCPVKVRCWAFAVALEQGKAIEYRTSVWGGTTPMERLLAEQPARPRPPKPEVDHISVTVTCECGCGLTFDAYRSENGLPRRVPRRFATSSCQARWRATVQGKRPMSEKRLCPVCDREFEPYTTFDGRPMTTKRKYDRPECLAKARQRRLVLKQGMIADNG